MEAPVARQTHPFVIVAAIAVTVFSLVGVGAVMGWIPTSIGGGGITAAKAPADVTEPAAQAPEPQKAQAETTKPAASNHVARRTKPHPRPVARSEPERAVVPPPPPPVVVAAVCRECAVIEEVREVEKTGEAGGGGAISGAIVGGVLGHQVGHGRGKDLATVAGAIGGGFAGHEIEKNLSKTKEYQIFVRYEDGNKGMFTQPTPPSWRPGDKVKIIDGAIQNSGS